MNEKLKELFANAIKASDNWLAVSEPGAGNLLAVEYAAEAKYWCAVDELLDEGRLTFLEEEDDGE